MNQWLQNLHEFETEKLSELFKFCTGTIPVLADGFCCGYKAGCMVASLRDEPISDHSPSLLTVVCSQLGQCTNRYS